MDFVVIVCIIIAVLISGIPIAMYCEYKSFNNGICPKCGKPLLRFDTDSHGRRGYCCRRCVYYTWISYYWVDRNFKNKN